MAAGTDDARHDVERQATTPSPRPSDSVSVTEPWVAGVENAHEGRSPPGRRDHDAQPGPGPERVGDGVDRDPDQGGAPGRQAACRSDLQVGRDGVERRRRGRQGAVRAAQEARRDVLLLGGAGSHLGHGHLEVGGRAPWTAATGRGWRGRRRWWRGERRCLEGDAVGGGHRRPVVGGLGGPGVARRGGRWRGGPTGRGGTRRRAPPVPWSSAVCAPGAEVVPGDGSPRRPGRVVGLEGGLQGAGTEIAAPVVEEHPDTGVLGGEVRPGACATEASLVKRTGGRGHATSPPRSPRRRRRGARSVRNGFGDGTRPAT